jgi:hypothetical protein
LGKLNFLKRSSVTGDGKEALDRQESADDILNPRSGYIGCLTTEQSEALRVLEKRLTDSGFLPSSSVGEDTEGNSTGVRQRVATQLQIPTLGREPCGHEDAFLTYMAGSRENTQRVLLQYLRARDFDIDRAHTLFSNTLRWRTQMRVCCVPQDAFQDPAATFPFVLVPGARNRWGHQLLLGKMVRFQKHFVSREAFRKAVISFLERCCYGEWAATGDASTSDSFPWPHSMERFTVIFDLSDGFDVFHNADLACYSDMITLVQSHYPERLGKVYIIHYSRYIHVFYRLLSHFIEEKTRAKIYWIPTTDIEQELRRDFPTERLPKFLGGELEFSSGV